MAITKKQSDPTNVRMNQQIISKLNIVCFYATFCQRGSRRLQLRAYSAADPAIPIENAGASIVPVAGCGVTEVFSRIVMV
jgi:hypothetical protein